MRPLPNQIFRWLEEENPLRILAVLQNDTTALLPLSGKTTKPHMLPTSLIQEALETGSAEILPDDPASVKNLPEAEIPSRQRQIRDNAWEVIKPIIALKPDKLFNRQSRWEAIESQSRKTGTQVKVIYDALRRYWQGGQVKNALLPNYANINKTVRKGKKSGPKSAGITVTDDVEKKFALGIKSFYEKASKPSMRDAYRRTIAKYFNTGYHMKNGIPVPVIPPEDQLPSERQFRYWYKNHRNPKIVK